MDKTASAAFPIRLFEKSWERFNLFWPAVPFLLISIFAATSSTLSEKSTNVMQFIAGAIFFNVVHTGFFPFILFCFPESRTWLNELSPEARRFEIGKWCVIFLALLALFNGMALMDGAAPIYLVFVLGFYSQLHHTIAQIRGLSCAYNQAMEKNGALTSEQVAQVKLSEKFDKFLFTALLATTGVDFFFEVSSRPHSRLLLTYIGFVLVLAILGNSLSLPYADRSNRSAYLLRLVFYPLGVYYPLFYLGVPFFHGIEYLLVFRKMWARSKVRSERSSRFVWTVIVPVGALVGLLSIFRDERGLASYIYGYFPDYKYFVLSIGALSIAVNFMHFYFDRKFFRMKDPNTRKHFGPLIT